MRISEREQFVRAAEASLVDAIGGWWRTQGRDLTDWEFVHVLNAVAWSYTNSAAKGAIREERAASPAV